MSDGAKPGVILELEKLFNTHFTLIDVSLYDYDAQGRHTTPIEDPYWATSIYDIGPQEVLALSVMAAQGLKFHICGGGCTNDMILEVPKAVAEAYYRQATLPTGRCVRLWDSGVVEVQKGDGTWSPVTDATPRFLAAILEHFFVHWDAIPHVKG